DPPHAVELIPDGLSPRANLVGRHHRVRGIYLRTSVLWDQPVTRDRYSADVRGIRSETLLPGFKIHGTRIWGQHDKLREGELGAIRDVDGRLERGRAIARESEDEGTKDVHAMLAERAQARDQRITHVVEALEDILQAFGCDSFHTHKRALDVGALHRIEERGVLRRLHGDLREEHHVGWQLRQAAHQLESLGPQRSQLLEPRGVALPLR